jgi:ferritin-like metal-binding protein YciE
MKNPEAVLNTYLTDMHAVEKHILEAVERQLDDDDLKKYPDASRVVTTLQTTLKRHCTAIETKIDARDGGDVKQAVKEAIGGALGFVAGLYDRVRDDEVSRMIRDDYTATSLAAVSYHMLHTTALALKNGEVADMALRHLKDLTPILVDLSKVVCDVVAKELAAENKVFDGTVGPQAVLNTQEAWSAQVAGH